MERSKVIKEFVRDEISVIQAMNILKLLLQDCKNEEILNWIDKEINGYKDDEEIPTYRILTCSVEGIIKSGNLVVSKMNIPIKEEFKDYIMRFKVRVGLNSIYQYSVAEKNSENHNLAIDIPLNYINSAADINPEFEVTHAKRTLGIYAYTNILNELKPILLNIFIQLEKEYGTLDNYYIKMNDDEKKDDVVKCIINILVDNSIAIGDNNVIKNSNIGENNEN